MSNDREAALACANEACRNIDGELDLDAMEAHFARHRQSEYARGLEDAAKVARAYLAMTGEKVRKSNGDDDLAAHGCTVAADIASSIDALKGSTR